MKKIFAISLLFLTLISSESFAKKNKIFFGANVFNANTNHFFDENAIVRNAENESAYIPYRKDSSASSIGVGGSAGYIGYYRKWFVSPELFFDYMNNSAPDFFSSESVGRGSGRSGVYKDDEMVVNFRYGARMNVGYNIVGDVNLFANAGVALVDYDMRRKNVGGGEELVGVSYGGYEISPIYGGGLNWEVNKDWIVQSAYDFQTINARYVFQGFVDVIDIHVIRVGLLMTF